MVAAQVATSPTFSRTGLEQLFQIPGGYVLDPLAVTYDLTSDDQTFLMVRSTAGQGGEVIVVQNFLDELRRRVPVD